MVLYLAQESIDGRPPVFSTIPREIEPIVNLLARGQVRRIKYDQIEFALDAGE